jgi:hypothetical protein
MHAFPTRPPRIPDLRFYKLDLIVKESKYCSPIQSFLTARSHAADATQA